MKINRSLVFLLVLLLILGLAACTRSLPTATAPATAVGGTPAASTSDVMGQLEQFVTQTALAAIQQGQGGSQTTPVPAGTTPQAPGEATSAPGAATSAPGEAGAATTAPGEAGAATVAPSEAGGGQATAAPAQPTATFRPYPTATPGLPATYALHGGEFPFCIARRFNVNQNDLLAASGLNLYSKPASGYQLTIPQNGNPFQGNRALKAHPTTYTVGSGESIYSIACQFGDVDPNAIAYVNGMTAPFNLTVGQTLQIP